MMKKKRLWAWFMAAVMAIGLLPVTALAAETTGGMTTPKTSVSTDSDKPIQIIKSVNEAGTEITMEAYVTKDVTTTTTSKPMDIVLVLDVSGSMDDPVSFLDSTHKIVVLKSAVKNFIDKVAKDATDNDAEHRISIVKFAGNKTEEPGDEQYNNGYVYNYSQIVKNLTDVKEDKDTLKTAVDGLRPAGSTRADNGLELAKNVLAGAKNDTTTSGETRGKVVIMFTDGEPSSFSDFNNQVAAKAINTAKELKDVGTTVYTIGMFDKNVFANKDVEKYMNAVSSNYPKVFVQWHGNGYNWEKFKYDYEKAERASEDYYYNIFLIARLYYGDVL